MAGFVYGELRRGLSDLQVRLARQAERRLDDAFDDADLREIEIRRGISPIISFKLISLVKGILFVSSITL